MRFGETHLLIAKRFCPAEITQEDLDELILNSSSETSVRLHFKSGLYRMPSTICAVISIYLAVSPCSKVIVNLFSRASRKSFTKNFLSAVSKELSV